MQKRNQGFTLIELLVVVLIIGILSAVALPQYQRAVVKSRYTQAKVHGHAIAEAQRVYYMANGTYGTLDELAIEIGGTSSTGSYKELERTFNWGYCVIEGIADAWANGITCTIRINGQRIWYQELFDSGLKRCVGDGTSGLTQDICKAETKRTTPSWCQEDKYCVYDY